jgi:CheY-like chemotaxis protein
MHHVNQDPGPLMTTRTASASPAEEAPRPRILVADDSSEMRALLNDLLVAEGYEVTTAASGARALSLMTDDPPDLLITDLLMPGMTGFALRALMLRRPDLAAIRVVVLSAYWHRPSETLDVAAVLTKPLNIDVLLDTVRRLTADLPRAATPRR